MKKYLIASGYDFSKERCWIVEESSKQKALEKFAVFYLKNDDSFIEYVADRCVNMSFAEKFWIQTEEENSRFTQGGEILIDEDEFRRRVQKYFGIDSHFSEEYLSFYFSDARVESLSKELLLKIWVEDLDEKDFIVIDMEEITNL